MEPSLACLVVLEGPDRGAVERLLPDRNRLGRDPAGEVVVHFPVNHQGVIRQATDRPFILDSQCRIPERPRRCVDPG